MNSIMRCRVLLIKSSSAVIFALSGAAYAQLVVDDVEYEPNEQQTIVNGDDLSRAQSMLRALDYDTGEPGAQNQKLTVAITTFQIRNNLEPADGKVSKSLLAALQVAINLQGETNTSSELASADKDPCLKDELKEVASNTRETSRRLGAIGRLLNRGGVDSDAVQTANNVSRNVAGVASDTQVLAGDCNP